MKITDVVAQTEGFLALVPSCPPEDTLFLRNEKWYSRAIKNSGEIQTFSFSAFWRQLSILYMLKISTLYFLLTGENYRNHMVIK